MSTRILCIEDQPEMASILAEGLRVSGFSAITTSTIISALEIVKLTPIDLILLDIIMPDVNGFAFFDLLAATSPRKEIPIIVVTGCTSHEAEETAYALGARDFIRKPFDLNQVVTSISTVLKTDAARLARKRTALQPRST